MLSHIQLAENPSSKIPVPSSKRGWTPTMWINYTPDPSLLFQSLKGLALLDAAIGAIGKKHALLVALTGMVTY